MTTLRVSSLTLGVWGLGCLDALAQESPWRLPSFHRIRFDFFGRALPGPWVLYLGIVLGLFIIGHGIHTLRKRSAHAGASEGSPSMRSTALTLLSVWGWIGGSYALISWKLNAPGAETGIVLFGSSLLGLLGTYLSTCWAIRASGRFARTAAQELGRDSSMHQRTLRLALNAGECVCLLALAASIPAPWVGDSWIGFLFGQWLGNCLVQADADRASLSEQESVCNTLKGFSSFGLRGIPLLLIIARLLDHSPALSASLILWLIAMRLVILLVTFIGSILEVQIHNIPDPQAVIAADPEAAHRKFHWWLTASAVGLIFMGSYFLLGDSRTFPSLWRTMAIWAGGGILIRSVLNPSAFGTSLRGDFCWAIPTLTLAGLCLGVGALTHNEPLLRPLQMERWALCILACVISACVLGDLRPGGPGVFRSSRDQSMEKQQSGPDFIGLILVLACLQVTLRHQQEGTPFSWGPHIPAIGLGVLVGGWLGYGLWKNFTLGNHATGGSRQALVLVVYLYLGLSLIQPYTAAACVVGLAVFGSLQRWLATGGPRRHAGRLMPEPLLPCASLTVLLALNMTSTAHSLRLCHLAGATLIVLSLVLRYHHRHGLTRSVT